MSNFHVDGDTMLGAAVVLGEVAFSGGVGDDPDLKWWARKYWGIFSAMLGHKDTEAELDFLRAKLKEG